MSVRKQGTAKISKVVAYIVIVLLVVAVCGVIAFFTNGFTSDFKTFYVVVDNANVMHSSGGYVLMYNESLTVDVKYTFGFLSKEEKGYSVKIIPKADEVDFDFIIDGSVYSFAAESDLTAGFDIVRSENSFTIAPKGSMFQILSAVYPDSEIEFDDSSIDFSKDLFTVVVTSYNGEASVYINFGILSCDISGITLDKTEIVF